MHVVCLVLQDAVDGLLDDVADVVSHKGSLFHVEAPHTRTAHCEKGAHLLGAIKEALLWPPARFSGMPMRHELVV